MADKSETKANRKYFAHEFTTKWQHKDANCELVLHYAGEKFRTLGWTSYSNGKFKVCVGTYAECVNIGSFDSLQVAQTELLSAAVEMHKKILEALQLSTEY